MVGGVLSRLGPARLAIVAAGMIASGAIAANEGGSPSAPAAPVTGAPIAAAASAVMPAAFYGMTEALRAPDLLRERMLAAHNGERLALGLPALEWDDALAQDAGRYAVEMAASGIFKHSPRAMRAIPAGENLWMGPRRLYDYAVMVGSFMDEKKHFKAGARLPDFSTTGRWQDVGHYTQAIWRGTKKLGCAVGDGAQHEYLVCRYFPAGNAFGKGPFDSDEVMLPAPVPASATVAVEMPVPATPVEPGGPGAQASR
ncbi:MAG: CAP domain-containing protein [Sphingobium sp.]